MIILLLKFIKIPTGLFAPVYYYLKKPNGGNLEGKYKGYWEFSEEVLRADMSDEEFARAGISYLTSGKFPESSHETEVTNKTEIDLYKK